MKPNIAFASLACRIVATGVMLVGAFSLTAQEGHLAFEVASVKPTPKNPNVAFTMTSYLNRPVAHGIVGLRFSEHGTSVGILMQRAYDVLGYQVLGLPDWADPARPLSLEYYDIDAVSPVENPSPTQVAAMLQSLLAGRFRLTTHREMKELPVYSLTIAKSGIKFKAKAEQTPPCCTIFELTNHLSHFVERAVVDHTGLSGYFDFPAGGIGELYTERPDSASAVSAFLANRFGLELRPARESVEVLVVDHVQRPSEN